MKAFLTKERIFQGEFLIKSTSCNLTSEFLIFSFLKLALTLLSKFYRKQKISAKKIEKNFNGIFMHIYFYCHQVY